MRRIAAVLVCSVVSSCSSFSDVPATQGRTETPLTLDRLVSGPSLTGSPPSAPIWSPDSRHFAFRWRGNASADATREIWLATKGGANVRRLTGGGSESSSVGDAMWLPSGEGLLFVRSGALWRVQLDGTTARAAEIGGGAVDLSLSPDGSRLAFRRAGDLWLVALASGEVQRVTSVGQPSISKLPIGRYRRREVEIGSYVWGGPTYAWSPDSRSIAVHHVDRRTMRSVPFPDYLGKETDPNFVRRTYPGDDNEIRRVGIFDVASGELRLLDLPDPESVRVVDFSWSRHGRLLIDRESDTAVDRWLHVLEPGAEAPTELWHDRRETRVYTSVGAAWHPDGDHLIVLSDRADRYGLYALHRERPEPKLLSDAAFDVLSPPVVSADGSIFYTSNDPVPHEVHVCRTTLAGGAARLTQKAGAWRPYPSPDGASLALVHSDDTTPSELYVRAVSGAGGESRRLTESTPAAFGEHAWVKPRYVTFASKSDGATLHARIFEPPGLDRTKRHPVVFGPVYSNTVRNRWGGFYGQFQQLLVARGYLVVQVDVRGSTGYGRAFREAFLGDFAGRDLEDLASAVHYLESLDYVDPERIGIWGSSYGGTLTAYALLKKPGLFDAGVACAAAVDPYFFGSDDVAIVRRPKSLPEAFVRGAAQYAANLEDPLLLIHGMQDQVVPFRTVVALAEALMRAGKDFDFAFAPRATHGWTRPAHYGRYLLGKLLAHFDRHLRNTD